LRDLQKIAVVPLQALYEGIVLLQNTDTLQRSRREHGRESYREYEARDVVAQEFDERPFAREIAAAGAQALESVPILISTSYGARMEIFVHAAPFSPIRQEECASSTIRKQRIPLDAHEYGDAPDIAVHGLYALHHDEHLFVMIAVSEQYALKRREIVVREALVSAGKAGSPAYEL
jgi:hypothetical protein